uniref:AAA domain-containing protein n=1 Tax=Panagrellus redivivus TaxID=6233 RepID=A0A7E4ZSL9_PANRE
MSIDWNALPITSTEWLEPRIEKDSIFHAIQHLGLRNLNVVQLDKHTETKRRIYGLIIVSHEPIKLEDEYPFVFDSEKVFGKNGFAPGLSEVKEQEKVILPTSTVKNCDLTVQLVNYALMASTQFAERCGPFLKRYFTKDMEQHIKKGSGLLAPIVPIAFAHNYTAVKYPAPETRKTYVRYFAKYYDRQTCNPDNELLLYADPNGDLIQFSLSECGINHIVREMERAGAVRIYAIVEDDSKALVEELVELKKESYGENIDSLLNTSSVDMSMSGGFAFDETGEDFTVNPLSDVSEIAAESENFLDAMDFDLVVEDAQGNPNESFKSAMDASLETVRSNESEDKFNRYRKLVKTITAAKKEFGKLWFHGMEDYDMLAHPEFEAFCSVYRLVLRADEHEMRLITSIQDGAPLEKTPKRTSGGSVGRVPSRADEPEPDSRLMDLSIDEEPGPSSRLMRPYRRNNDDQSNQNQSEKLYPSRRVSTGQKAASPSPRVPAKAVMRRPRKHADSVSSTENMPSPSLKRKRQSGKQVDPETSPSCPKRKVLTPK